MKLILAVVVWISVLIAILWYTGTGQMNHFSPNNAAINDQAIIDKSRTLFDGLTNLNTKLVEGSVQSEPLYLLHISKPNCRCNWVATPHIESVKQLATNNNYSNIEVNVEDDPTWLSLVPSAPAVIAIKGNELLYFGPYSTGPTCLPGNGLIEPFITATNTKPTVLLDGYGCYCNL